VLADRDIVFVVTCNLAGLAARAGIRIDEKGVLVHHNPFLRVS
jgi:peroxiredoxin